MARDTQKPRDRGDVDDAAGLAPVGGSFACAAAQATWKAPLRWGVSITVSMLAAFMVRAPTATSATPAVVDHDVEGGGAKRPCPRHDRIGKTSSLRGRDLGRHLPGDFSRHRPSTRSRRRAAAVTIPRPRWRGGARNAPSSPDEAPVTKGPTCLAKDRASIANSLRSHSRQGLPSLSSERSIYEP